MSKVCRTIAMAILAMGVSLAAASPGLAGSVQVLKTVPYAPQSGAPPKVKQQCALETGFPEALAAVSDDVKLVSKFSGGRSLELLIRDVHAPPAGPFSGPKWVTIYGTLKEGSRNVASFRAKRLTVFGGGTCSMLNKCLSAIADDVAEWLKEPTKEALLGDAK